MQAKRLTRSFAALLIGSMLLPSIWARQTQTEETRDRVPTQSDTEQTYALVVPKNFEDLKAADGSRRWPVLLGFSPGGNGQRVAATYRAAAERYGWIVLASNNSRNGSWDVIQAATQALWEEAHEQYPIDLKRIYTTGMSGGAAVAAMVASVHPGEVAGVFMHARGEWSTLPRAGSQTFYRVHAGLHDFNLGETLRFLVHARRMGCIAGMDVHPGGHGWAPASIVMGDVRFAELLYGVLSSRETPHKELVRDELEFLKGALQGPFAFLARQQLLGISQLPLDEPATAAVQDLLNQQDSKWLKTERSAWKKLEQGGLFDTQVQGRYPGLSSLKEVVEARRELTDRFPGTTAGLLMLCVDLNARISLGRAKVEDSKLKAAYQAYMDGAALKRPKFRKIAVKLLRKKKLVPALTALFEAHVLEQVDGKKELAKPAFKRLRKLPGSSWFTARQRSRTRR